MLVTQKLTSASDYNASAKTGTIRVGTWDGWRGTAILLVLCGHFYDLEWVWEDRMGVDIFFVLSGMLMSTILFEKRLSLKDFYIRRLSRVYPVLLVYVTAIFGFSWLQDLNFSHSEITGSLLFLRTYYPSEPGIWSSEVAIGHLWSLNVEEHAYLILSILTLALINRKYIGILLLALGCGSVGLGFYYYSTLSIEDFRLFLIRTESAIVFIFFSAGYGLLKRRGEWKGHPVLPALCLCGGLLCYAEALPLWLIFSVSPVLLSIAVNHLDNLHKPLNWILTVAPLRYLGIYSYSIYIWQQFFYEYAWVYPMPKPLVSLLTIAVGVLSYHALENPVRKFINTRWSKNPTYRAGGAAQ